MVCKLKDENSEFVKKINKLRKILSNISDKYKLNVSLLEYLQYPILKISTVHGLKFEYVIFDSSKPGRLYIYNGKRRIPINLEMDTYCEIISKFYNFLDLTFDPEKYIASNRITRCSLSVSKLRKIVRNVLIKYGAEREMSLTINLDKYTNTAEIYGIVNFPNKFGYINFIIFVSTENPDDVLSFKIEPVNKFSELMKIFDELIFELTKYIKKVRNC